MSPYRAVVIGGTGAVGSALVQELLASPRCSQVVVVGRTEPAPDAFGVTSQKLSIHAVNMDQLAREAIDHARSCDAAFCTMGVGQPRKVGRKEFWKVDVEYASAFGRACKIAGVRHFTLLSSVGANANSSNNYLHVKGVVEERIQQLRFERASFFRPSLLLTKKIRYGLQDFLAQALYPAISWALAPRFHQIRVTDLGRAMRLNAERPAESPVEALTYPEFLALLQAN